MTTKARAAAYLAPTWARNRPCARTSSTAKFPSMKTAPWTWPRPTLSAKARMTPSWASAITAGSCRHSTVRRKSSAAAIPSACSTASVLVSAAPATASSAPRATPVSVRTASVHASSMTWRSSRWPTSAWNLSPCGKKTSRKLPVPRPGLRSACVLCTRSPTTSSWWANWARTA
ncbi:hypothetical protein D3C86_1462620 [compost metagenome]